MMQIHPKAELMDTVDQEVLGIFHNSWKCLLWPFLLQGQGFSLMLHFCMSVDLIQSHFYLYVQLPFDCCGTTDLDIYLLFYAVQGIRGTKFGEHILVFC